MELLLRGWPAAIGARRSMEELLSSGSNRKEKAAGRWLLELDGWIEGRRLAARGFGQEDGCSDLVGWRWIGRDPKEDAGESGGG